MRRVVITGIGMVTPAGGDLASTWQRLQAGTGCARWLSAADLSPAIEPPTQRPDSTQRTGSATAVRWYGAPAMPRSRAVDDSTAAAAPVPCDAPELAWLAALEAIQQSGLNLQQVDRRRVGVVVGTSKGAFKTVAAELLVARSQTRGAEPSAADALRPDWFSWTADCAARTISQRLDLIGPVLAPVAACATGSVAIARAAELIEQGDADIVVCGGADASLHPGILGSFQRLGVLASPGVDPAAACRPFDAQRTGFVIGEGAGVLVLESAQSAVSRGARILARWRGAALGSLAGHLTQLNPDPADVAHLIAQALDVAKVHPAEIDYINVHGTATRANDRLEADAIRAVFGARAESIPCSSLKGALGHLLGAAGSVEVGLCVQMLEQQILLPNVNLLTPDPELRLGLLRGRPQPGRVRSLLKLSLGFGGHLAAIVLSGGEDSQPA